MKSICFVIVAALALNACKTTKPYASSGLSADASASEAAVTDLVGVWDVALYFDPTKPPSSTVLEFTKVEAGIIEGSFYQTSFSIAKATVFEGDVVVSFITEDNSGPYAGAGRLSADGTFKGQTLSVGRDFVMPWTASRRVEEN